jgi:hypothetical protein
MTSDILVSSHKRADDPPDRCPWNTSRSRDAVHFLKRQLPHFHSQSRHTALSNPCKLLSRYLSHQQGCSPPPEMSSSCPLPTGISFRGSRLRVGIVPGRGRPSRDPQIGGGGHAGDLAAGHGPDRPGGDDRSLSHRSRATKNQYNRRATYHRKYRRHDKAELRYQFF